MKWVFFLLVFSLISAKWLEDGGLDEDHTEALSAYKAPNLLRLDSSYLEKYPWIDFNKNYFQFFSEESPNWEKLSERFRDMKLRKQGKLNFYHMGGSHIQADIYTHEVRTKIQTELNLLTGDRAWVFPYDLARTNNPWNYEFSSSNKWERFRCTDKENTAILGLMGMKVVSYDSVSKLHFRYDKSKFKNDIQIIRVYHSTGLFPFTLDWKDKNHLVKSSFTDTILGYTEVKFSRPFLTFDLAFTRTIPRTFPLEIYGFELKNVYPGISYSSIGVNGATLNHFNACVRLEKDLKASPPDFFAISLGTNDGNVPSESFDSGVYKENLDNLIRTILRVNPRCAILLTVPNDAYYLRENLNPNIEKQRLVIRELAQKYQCPIWDFYGIMGELGSSKIWWRHQLMQGDLVHFTVAGYHLKADLYYDALEKVWLQFADRQSIKSK